MSFDRLAPHYDWLELLTAGDRLQRARRHWLDALVGCRTLLSAGEGHGRFAAACLDRFPDLKLTCIEASPGMLRRGRRRNRKHAESIRWHCANVADWKGDHRFDALATCFFLDCFPPDLLEIVVARLASSAADRAVWLVTDFALPPRGFARWRALAVHWLMYRFFRIATRLPAHRLTPPDPWLERHGFRLAGRQEFEWGLIRADLWVRGES